MLTRYVFYSFLYSHQYEGYLEVIWTWLICSNFIIIRLDIRELLSQNIPLLVYILLTSPWEFPYGFTEQFF